MSDQTKKGPIDFYTFVFSLGSSAIVHLGDAPHPETGAPAAPDLLLAKQTIDILVMLRDKTKGNLTAEEAKFLEALLMDLQMRFVERSGKTAPPKG
jgi:hypothetical protein